MSEAPNGTDAQSPAAKPEPRGRRALLARHPWITFLLPLLVYMLVNMLEPAADQGKDAGRVDAFAAQQSTPDQDKGESWLPSLPREYYPIVYTVKIILTVAAIIFVLPGYREFPLRVSPLAVWVGVVGIVFWVGLCQLHLERDYLRPLLEPIGLDRIIASGTRVGFNPLEELAAHPARAWGFLAIRFLGLVAVVPVIEELFLRGFLMRFVVAAEWREVPIGRVNAVAVLIGTLLYPLLTHPAEALAAVVWFSMVTWLMVKTRNIWDCVAAHAVTNLLLGIYVVVWDQWQLM